MTTTTQDFLTKMKEEVLDTEMDITMDTLLGDIEEWDSLGVVTFIAMAKSACGKKVERTAIVNAKTLQDLYALLQ